MLVLEGLTHIHSQPSYLLSTDLFCRNNCLTKYTREQKNDLLFLWKIGRMEKSAKKKINRLHPRSLLGLTVSGIANGLPHAVYWLFKADRANRFGLAHGDACPVFSLEGCVSVCF